MLFMNDKKQEDYLISEEYIIIDFLQVNFVLVYYVNL